MKRPTLTACLSILVEGGEPPTAQCLFKSGWNETRKGRFLFDAQAARSVMGAYETHGIDLMFDLEHLSTDDAHPNFDPDARGWGRLEVKDDGELWAVDIKWTTDGDKRLREKRQRYISPYFTFDQKTRRVSRVINVAITSLPATDHTTPLVAAREGEPTMDLKKLCAALGLPEDATEEEVIAAIAKMKGDQEAMIKKLADMEKPTEEPPKAAANRELAAEVVKLSLRLAEIEIRDVLRQRQVTPAIEKWALSQRDPSVVRELVSLLPKAATSALLREPAPKDKGEGEQEVKLSATDRRVCELTGTSEAEFLKKKKEIRAQDAARRELEE